MTRVTKMGRKKYVEATGWEKMKQTKDEKKSQALKRIEMKKKGEKQQRKKFKGKDRHLICFFCRKRGHSVANCKDRLKSEGENTSNNATGICFRCGSTEHTLKNCKVPVKKGEENVLPYAQCYVCNQKGHLASQCSQNEKGLYPNGGCCKYCGSVRHLAKDCDPANKKEKELIEIGTIDANQGADDDDVFTALKRMQDEKDMKKKAVNKPVAPKKKVVSF
ncbi:hypothetical protein BCR36DRAFT_586746 [Piromyces finnis]|uniref:CCHC-type domain-containing protein n=1 Tax=Piromyces finnis TaxID=1754191 RepID=A0A1Y1UZF4_9FUNG|nr:hypothetical protein BCR36DRAFT_586746 [Piromyces finnis]|eukprot:ORX43264.1 hypothetical protein BCR36DRAFT_586746 [Piromyces finnis]